MEAEQVTEKILADAKAEAEKIKKAAAEKQANEQAAFDKQLSAYQTQTDALAQKAAKAKKTHLLSTARMEIAKQFLTEKRKILDEVFNQAGQQLRNLPDKEYRMFMTKLMLGAAESGEEEVIIDKNENRIDQELINQVNEQLASRGKGHLKLSEVKQDIGGGFILKRGKIKTNVSIDLLLTQARKELEIELAKDLFAE